MIHIPDQQAQGTGDDLGQTLRELRQALAHGLLSDAEHLGARARELMERSPPERPALQRFDRLLGWLLDAIGLAVAGDHRGALTLLDRVTARANDSPSLRWAGWLWSCWAALGLEQLDVARTAASQAVDLSGSFTPHCHGISLCAQAEVSASLGEHDEAAALLRQTRADDPTVCMFRARILADIGRQEEAEQVTMQAASIAPDWVEPPLFLATLALMQGKLEATERHLADLSALGPWPQGAHRLSSLLRFVRSGWPPLQVIVDYLHLRDAPATESLIEELQTLVFYAPTLYHLREELAWQLLKLERHDEAQRHFEQLAGEELDPAVMASVQLGLSSLASLRRRSQPPGAQVRAATRAGRQTPSLDQPAVPPRATDPKWIQHALKKVAGNRPAFSGDLRILAFPDLLEFLRNGRRSGTLVLQSTTGTSAIHLRGGLVTSALAPGCAAVGDLLVERGAVTPEELEEVASSQQHDDRGDLLGALLVDRGLVRPELMKEALAQQVLFAIRTLFGWHEGQFAFLPDATLNDRTSIEIELDPRMLLLEAARQLDEENQ